MKNYKLQVEIKIVECDEPVVIDQQHNKDWLTQDIQTLGQILKNCREIQFQKLWEQVTGKNCPQELFSAIQVASEGNKD